MRELIASVTTRGQVTIPSEIRKHLDLRSPDKIAFIIDETGTVQLRPARVTLEDLFESVPPIPGRETIDFDDFIDEAMQAEADQIVREMGGL